MILEYIMILQNISHMFIIHIEHDTFYLYSILQCFEKYIYRLVDLSYVKLFRLMIFF